MIRKVFFVDDEAYISESLKIMARNVGLDAYSESSPEKALEEIGKVHPDLVVTDVLMPGMSGLELCKKLKARAPDLRVWFLTACKPEESEMRECGADACFEKPSMFSELKERMNAIN